MTSGESPRRAEQIIDHLLELLDETRMSQEIDERIDTAAADFRWADESPATHVLFHRTVAVFVQHLWRHAMHPPQTLSDIQAHTEAVALLDQVYEGAHARGCEAALLDATDPAQGGLGLVLDRLREAIKTRERQKHVRWAFNACVDPLDWHLRCQITETLLARLNRLLPPSVLRCPPSQMVDHFPNLILAHLGTDSLIRHLTQPTDSLGL